jgi:hypothetical protein
MERRFVTKQEALEKRLLAFLNSHLDRWFTVQELTNEQVVAGSLAEIQSGIMAMQRQGLVKSQKKGPAEPWSYQAVTKSDSAP